MSGRFFDRIDGGWVIAMDPPRDSFASVWEKAGLGPPSWVDSAPGQFYALGGFGGLTSHRPGVLFLAMWLRPGNVERGQLVIDEMAKLIGVPFARGGPWRVAHRVTEDAVRTQISQALQAHLMLVARDS